MNKSSKRSHSRETAENVTAPRTDPSSHPPRSNSADPIPQSSKTFTLQDADSFCHRAVKLFNHLAELNDLKNLYELGKQLSRLYFDCAEFRAQISARLIKLDFPDYAVRTMKRLNNMGIFKHDDIWFSSFYFYNICWNFSECSAEFAGALAQAGLPSLLIMNILHKPYLDNLSSRNIYFLIKASLSIMHNLCRYPGNRYLFKTDKVKETLIDFTSREEELIRVISILCLAFLLEEEDAGHLVSQQPHFVFSFIDIVTKAKLHDRGRFMGFATWELLQALAVFNSNDSVKRDVAIEARGATTVFDILSKAGNVEEVRECLAVIWNWSFDPELKTMLIKQFNCLIVIDPYVNHEDEEVRSAAAGIKWLLEDSIKSAANRLLASETPPPPACTPGLSSHVFLCFTEEPVSREAVYRIADRLRRASLVVNLPRNCPLEPAIRNQESRFRGIAHSALFVLVLSEATKASQRCRAETQFAAHLKKPIIPVIVQPKFRQSNAPGSSQGPPGSQGSGGGSGGHSLATSGWMDRFTDKVFFDLSSRRDFEVNLDALRDTLVTECLANSAVANLIINNNNNNVGGGVADDTRSVHSAKSGRQGDHHQHHHGNHQVGGSGTGGGAGTHHHGNSSGRLSLGASLEQQTMSGVSRSNNQATPPPPSNTAQFNHSASLDSSTNNAPGVGNQVVSSAGGGPNNIHHEYSHHEDYHHQLVSPRGDNATSNYCAGAVPNTTTTTTQSNPNLGRQKLSINNTNNYQANLEQIKKWTKEEVAEWLVNSDLSHLRLKLSKFNGTMLASLLEIKREAPEYFYKCLEDKIELHFMDTLAFIDALHKLVN